MTRLLLFFLGVGLLVLAGCSGNYEVPLQPPAGFLYENYKAPLTVSFHETPVGTKCGSSVAHYIYEPYFTRISLGWGGRDADEVSRDATADGVPPASPNHTHDIRAAARAGGMTKVYYADYQVFNVFGVYRRFIVETCGD